MQRTYMIEAHETLLIVLQRKLSYIRESEYFDIPMSTCDVLDELRDDDAAKVLRLDRVTMKVDDITEQCAREYLYRMDRQAPIRADDEKLMPIFVRQSREWSLMKDDIEAQRPIRRDFDAVYDTLRDMQAAE